MVGLSIGEKHFIKGGIAQDLRTDGRKRLTHRPIYVETGVIPQVVKIPMFWCPCSCSVDRAFDLNNVIFLWFFERQMVQQESRWVQQTLLLVWRWLNHQILIPLLLKPVALILAMVADSRMLMLNCLVMHDLVDLVKFLMAGGTWKTKFISSWQRKGFYIHWLQPNSRALIRGCAKYMYLDYSWFSFTWSYMSIILIQWTVNIGATVRSKQIISKHGLRCSLCMHKYMHVIIFKHFLDFLSGIISRTCDLRA